MAESSGKGERSKRRDIVAKGEKRRDQRDRIGATMQYSCVKIRRHIIFSFYARLFCYGYFLS